ncbi:MAG: dienelactone hydrolase family protein [Abitibacteriaceae bacterium]|nr:dienelactone hydrolase family protein [Abditibacteriaceae bacterium]MBV9868480.1 dienelactone hydrolase family protein [Abditibacteriaceae bacterium]
MISTVQNVVIPTKSLDIPAVLLVPQTPLPTLIEAVAADTPNVDGVEVAPAAGAQSNGTKFPALVVLHDIYGLDEATHEAAQRLRDLGYITITPDLYAHSGAPKDTSSDKAILSFMLALDDSRLISDALAAVQWLAQREDVDTTRIGIIGWGSGGAYALMAGSCDGRLRTVIDIGGHITYPVLTAQKPGSPLNFVADLEGTFMGAFAGSDPTLPKSEIERLIARLTEHDKRGEVKVYPDAPPRFWRDPALPQTAQLWRRLENFLKDNLLEFEASDEPIEDYPNEDARLYA